MKRLLSSTLALTLILGCVPAQAQMALGRVSLQTGVAAPTPVFGGLVPVSGSFAPVLSAPTLPLASVLTPAAYAPVQGTARAQSQSPVAILRAVAAPERTALAGAAFDGLLSRSAASTVEPPSSPEPAAGPRPGPLQRYKNGRGKNPLQNAFGKAMFVASVGASAAPILWGAAPALKFVYAAPATNMLMLAIVIPLAVGIAVWRKMRGTPQTASKPPPSRRAMLAVAAAGTLLGIGLAAVPYHATGPAVENIRARMDLSLAVEARAHVAWISGGAVEDETIQVLSRNPSGRELLNKLRDRAGTIRLPTFFISQQNGSYAQHEKLFDGVYISKREVANRGWTIERFLNDPALQRQLIREMDSTVFHELVHAVQGRRPLWTTGYLTNSIEAEQEAFFRQTLYLIAKLEADPNARNAGDDSWMISSAADNLDAYLSFIAGLYDENVVVGEPYFNAFLAQQRARWPVYRVHLYQLLSARASTPESAKMYLDKAKAAAKAVGLPEPAALVASR